MKLGSELRKRLARVTAVTVISLALIVWAYGVLIRGGSPLWAAVYTVGFLALALIPGLAVGLYSERRRRNRQ
jgi:Na+/proline symporter